MLQTVGWKRIPTHNKHEDNKYLPIRIFSSGKNTHIDIAFIDKLCSLIKSNPASETIASAPLQYIFPLFIVCNR